MAYTLTAQADTPERGVLTAEFLSKELALETAEYLRTVGLKVTLADSTGPSETGRRDQD